MNNKWKRVSPEFREKIRNAKIEIASTIEIEKYEEIKIDFMRNIFGYEAHEYALSDESILEDFDIEYDSKKIEEKINEFYDIDISKLENKYLYKVFETIEKRKEKS
jgi:hypothetical protein